MRVHANLLFCTDQEGRQAHPQLLQMEILRGLFFARGFDASAYMNLGGVRFAVDGPPRLAVFPAG
jgi:hypothetical protein